MKPDTHTKQTKKRYHTPMLEYFGAVRHMTSGGTANQLESVVMKMGQQFRA
ncbi:MAG: hypothetical protein LJE74_00135 [Proteobacteria bacterium]|jgi:hypothetical protein|nr:hypothetical protein [Pseudomonadota bacterium]